MSDYATSLREMVEAVTAGPWAADAALIAAAPDLARKLADTIDALETIAALQPEALRIIRDNGFVFESALGKEPGNWEHLAFSFYTSLCEAESIASPLLSRITEGSDE